MKPATLDLHESLVETAGDRVFFDDASAKLSEGALAVVKMQARWLKANPNVEVRVVGHADDSGSPRNNMRLSHDRAVAVRKRLIRYGVAAHRLHVFGQGKAQPIAICDVRTCAAQNRRVVMEIRSADSAAPSRR